MRFEGSDSNGKFAGANENTVIQTNADGTFSYTFTETYAAIPVVIPTGISAGTGPISALQPKMTSITLTGCSGVIYGMQQQNVLLSLGGVVAPVNTTVSLSTPVTVQLMVLGKGA